MLKLQGASGGDRAPAHPPSSVTNPKSSVPVNPWQNQGKAFHDFRWEDGLNWIHAPVSPTGLIAFVALAVAVCSVTFLLHREYARTRGAGEKEAKSKAERTTLGETSERSSTPPSQVRTVLKIPEWWFAILAVVVALFVFGLAITYYLVHSGNNFCVFVVSLFVELTALVWLGTFAGGAWKEWNLRNKLESSSRRGPAWNALRFAGLLVLGLPASVVGTLAGVWLARLLTSPLAVRATAWLYLDNLESLQVVAGGLLFAWLPLMVIIVAAGLIGPWYPNWLGEWLARIRAYSLLGGLAWTALSGTSLLMPWVVRHLCHSGWIKMAGQC